MKVRKLLIVRADGAVRISSGKRVMMSQDEIGFWLDIVIPDSWGKIRGKIELQMPDPPTVTANGELERGKRTVEVE